MAPLSVLDLKVEDAQLLPGSHLPNKPFPAFLPGILWVLRPVSPDFVHEDPKTLEPLQDRIDS